MGDGHREQKAGWRPRPGTGATGAPIPAPRCARRQGHVGSRTGDPAEGHREGGVFTASAPGGSTEEGSSLLLLPLVMEPATPSACPRTRGPVVALRKLMARAELHPVVALARWLHLWVEANPDVTVGSAAASCSVRLWLSQKKPRQNDLLRKLAPSPSLTVTCHFLLINLNRNLTPWCRGTCSGWQREETRPRQASGPRD